MATWTKFFIKADEIEPVVEQLLSLADDLEVSTGPFPDDFYDSYLFDQDQPPDYLVAGKTQPDWITVTHNSFKLTEWGETLSKALNTMVIITDAQSVSSYYYFALFDKGKKVREIEACYSEDFEMVNYGERFNFEGPEPGSKVDFGDGEDYLFNFDSMEEYCKHFGLEIEADYETITWTILQGKQTRRRISDVVKQLTQSNRPWWKFW